MHQLQEAFSGQRGVDIPEQTAEGRVDPSESAILADDAQQFGREVEELVELFLQHLPFDLGTQEGL